MSHTDTDQITFAQFRKSLREPVLSPERQEIFNTLSPMAQEYTLNQLMDARLEPAKDLLSDMANGSSGELKLLAVHLATRIHRTLQQETMRSFIVPFIKAMALTEYADGRNQASVDLSKKLLPIIEETYLPLV